MLDQLFNIVKQFGQETVVNNPDVPNEYNHEVMADATQTIAGGFKNIVAGGGLQNIIDLFKGGGNTAGGNSSGDIGGLIKNPIVSMMVGYFINKLVGKYSMSPSVASNVANTLIPKSLNSLIQQTKDPDNENINLDGFIGSLIGGSAEAAQPAASNSSPLQDLLDSFTGGGKSSSGTGGFDLQDIISKFTQKTQNSFENEKNNGGGGLMDIIKGFIN